MNDSAHDCWRFEIADFVFRPPLHSSLGNHVSRPARADGEREAKSFFPRTRVEDVPSRAAQSDAMSRELKGRGFGFAGTTSCYAFMQAIGMVNDHLVDCFRHRQLRG